jgi:hypothetical protein
MLSRVTTPVMAQPATRRPPRTASSPMVRESLPTATSVMRPIGVAKPPMMLATNSTRMGETPTKLAKTAITVEMDAAA